MQEMNSPSASCKNLSVFALPVDGLHPGFAVVFACGNPFWGYLFDPVEVFARELDVHGGEVLFEAFAAPDSRDGADVVALMEQPRQRELPWRYAFLRGEFPHPVHEFEVLLEVLARETRGGAAEVVLRKVVG